MYVCVCFYSRNALHLEFKVGLSVCGFLFFFFWKVPKSVDDKGSWASKDRWLDWVWFFVAYWGHYMNRFVRKSYKTPQGKNAISPKQ